MSNLSNDPIINVINNGIKKGIRVTCENECYGSALILIYSGIDTMAFLNMPKEKQNVTKEDFIRWVERYINFSSKDKISGLEFYSARCGIVHNYSAFSSLTRESRCRIIVYHEGEAADVFSSNNDNGLVFLKFSAFKNAFFSGVDNFLIDVFSSDDEKRKKLIEERFQLLIHKLVFNNFGSSPI